MQSLIPYLYNIVDYISKNKEWIFSGIGVTFLTLLSTIIFYRLRKRSKTNISVSLILHGNEIEKIVHNIMKYENIKSAKFNRVKNIPDLSLLKSFQDSKIARSDDPVIGLSVAEIILLLNRIGFVTGICANNDDKSVYDFLLNSHAYAYSKLNFPNLLALNIFSNDELLGGSLFSIKTICHQKSGGYKVNPDLTFPKMFSDSILGFKAHTGGSIKEIHQPIFQKEKEQIYPYSIFWNDTNLNNLGMIAKTYLNIAAFPETITISFYDIMDIIIIFNSCINSIGEMINEIPSNLEWDIYLSTYDNLINEDYDANDKRLIYSKIYSKLPKYIWLAHALNNSNKIISFVFDATCQDRIPRMLFALEWNKLFSEVLVAISSLNITEDIKDNEIFKWYLSKKTSYNRQTKHP